MENKDIEKLTKRAEQGDAAAIRELADYYLEQKNYKNALELYLKLADQNDAEVLRRIGYCCFFQKDYKKAVEWWFKAAEMGNPKAQNHLGYSYQNGVGVEQDLKKAVEWYSKAAEGGNAIAQYNLGLCYKKGNGVEQNHEKAVEWFSKAADQGEAGAQRNMSICYHNGEGVERDYKKAVEWTLKAAEQGDKISIFNLGACYIDGIGVERDAKKAVELYTKAAELGYVLAQRNLGGCYKDGTGVERNYDTAEYWYKKAAEQGDEYAKTQVERFNSERKFQEHVKLIEQGDSDAQGDFGPVKKVTVKGTNSDCRDLGINTIWFENYTLRVGLRCGYSKHLTYNKDDEAFECEMNNLTLVVDGKRIKNWKVQDLFTLIKECGLSISDLDADNEYRVDDVVITEMTFEDNNGKTYEMDEDLLEMNPIFLSEMNELLELCDDITLGLIEIDEEKVAKLESAYGIKAPYELKAIVSQSDRGILARGVSAIATVLNFDDMLNVDVDLFKKKGYIPVMMDCWEQSYFVYSPKTDTWLNIEEDGTDYFEDDSLCTVLKAYDGDVD
ncbi:MAG: sel1 repeat family protein [Paludibacteraceae bacterium]|nr:sel1 repeat family protein [Paludibacteraceae bacterium]